MPDSITARQKRAISALLVSPNAKAAADLAKIGERTLYRWLAEDAAFNAALRAAEDEAFKIAIARLAGELPASVNALAEIRDTRRYPPSTRVAAARTLMAEVRHQREFAELAARLDELEELINERKETNR